MEAGSTDIAAIQAALDGLAAQLGGQDFRTALREDPTAAVAGTDIDAAKLPPGLLDTLGQMSDEELQIVSRVHGTLKGSIEESFPEWSALGILF